MQKVVSGLQQIGIGVSNFNEAWAWYRKYFGMDIRIFEESAAAELMLPFTGGKSRKRHAALAMNLQSGGGFEIWQYTDRTPEPPKFEVQIGDYGIFATKVKCKDVKATYEHFKKNNLDLVGDLITDPSGNDHFFIRDPYGNLFQLVNGSGWFKDEKRLTGGTCGCMIGVSDIEKSRVIYSDIIGYDEVVYDKEGQFEDFSSLPGGKHNFRRVLLKHSKPWKGGFCNLFGPSQIELISVKDRTAKKIFEDRYWGDLGFIHVCFDIVGMDYLRNECAEKGFSFAVDSSQSFDMGEAAGHFSYIEDPDGTLIEFVETHKVPIIKKLGLYFNLKKRNPEKALPDWLVRKISFLRVRG